MTNLKGTILDVEGLVKIVGKDFSRLRVGDIIDVGELLEFAKGSFIKILLTDGKLLQLTDNPSIHKISDYLNKSDKSIEEIQEQILAGADPSKITDATSAGGAAPGAGGSFSEGTHEPLVVDQVNNMGIVTSGYDTRSILKLSDVLQNQTELVFTYKPQVNYVKSSVESVEIQPSVQPPIPPVPVQPPVKPIVEPPEPPVQPPVQPPIQPPVQPPVEPPVQPPVQKPGAHRAG